MSYRHSDSEKAIYAMTRDHSALLELDALTSADSASVFAELIRAGLMYLEFSGVRLFYFRH